MHWIILLLSLMASNLIYNGIKDRNWGRAAEITFFQWVAVFIIYINKPWE